MIKIIKSKFFTIVAIAVVLFLGYSLSKKFPAFQSSREDLRYAEKKIAETKEYEKTLEQESSLLGSEAYLEQQARLKLNYRKPGEQVVYIYHQNTPAPTSAPEHLSFWKKLVNYFKSRD